MSAALNLREVLDNTSLQTHWDRLLAAEGLAVIQPGHQTNGAALDSHEWFSLEDQHHGPTGEPQLDSDAWTVASIWDHPRSVANSDRVHAAEQLIARFPPDGGCGRGRARNWQKYVPFFRAWAETGRVRESALATGVKPAPARSWLGQVREHFLPDRAKRPLRAPPGANNGGASFYASRAHLPDPWIGRYQLDGEQIMVGTFASKEEAQAAVAVHRAKSAS